MKKVLSLLVIIAFVVFGLSSLTMAADNGSAVVKLVIVSAGKNLLVKSWGDYVVVSGTNTIFGYNPMPQGFEIDNIGNQNVTLQLQITNVGGLTLVTNGTPGTKITATNQVRMAGVFVEWNMTPALTEFAANDVLKRVLVTSTTNVFRGPNSGWGTGVNVEPNGQRPLAINVDMNNKTPLGTSFNVMLYVKAQ